MVRENLTSGEGLVVTFDELEHPFGPEVRLTGAGSKYIQTL
jgi:hypothetical protein